MFDFLKKKINSWIGKDDSKKESKKEKKKKDKSKPVKEIKKEEKRSVKVSDIKKTKVQKPDLDKEKTKEEEVKKIVEEEKVEEVKEVIKNEIEKAELEEKPKEEKKGFFTKLFSKKEEKKEIIEEEKSQETIKEEPIETLEKEEVEEEIKDEKPGFFSKIFNKITKSELTKADFDDAFDELEITLLENNVALAAVDKIKEILEKDLVGKQISQKEAQEKIVSALKEAILSVLQEPPNLIKAIENHDGVYMIIFFGINGTGKTTSIAKIAHMLKKNHISCVLAAADTFRAASIEQLKFHADKLEVPIISSSYGSDPASVIFEAKKYAQTNNIKVVLADTAGRMYTKENLIKEMEKIMRVNKPELKIFVGESITGNDAIDQATTFNDAIGIDGIILSKADIDEKAGTILSVSHVTNKPIYFLGTGQNYDDLVVFSKKEVLKNLGLED